MYLSIKMQQYVVLVLIMVGVTTIIAAAWQCFFNRYRAHREVVMQKLSESIDNVEQDWETKSLEVESMLDE